MTHGDQAKAKAAKSSQASGSKKSSSQTAGQALQGGKTGKGGQSPVKKAVTAAPISGKEAGNGGKVSSTKGRPAAAPPPDDGPGFSNAAVEAAFKRALKKYPNAFRKLTD
jgi:hypothetical protein